MAAGVASGLPNVHLQRAQQKRNYKYAPPYGYGGNLSSNTSIEKLDRKCSPRSMQHQYYNYMDQMFNQGDNSKVTGLNSYSNLSKQLNAKLRPDPNLNIKPIENWSTTKISPHGKKQVQPLGHEVRKIPDSLQSVHSVSMQNYRKEPPSMPQPARVHEHPRHVNGSMKEDDEFKANQMKFFGIEVDSETELKNNTKHFYGDSGPTKPDKFSRNRQRLSISNTYDSLDKTNENDRMNKGVINSRNADRRHNLTHCDTQN